MVKYNKKVSALGCFPSIFIQCFVVSSADSLYHSSEVLFKDFIGAFVAF